MVVGRYTSISTCFAGHNFRYVGRGSEEMILLQFPFFR